MRLRPIAAAVLAVCGLSVLAAPAGAGRHMSGSGTFADASSNTVSVQSVGDNTVIVLQNVIQWTGPINGTAQETLTVVAPPTGDASFYGVDVCSCTDASGRTGVVTILLKGHDNGTTFHGRFRIAESAGLAGLRGARGTFDGSDATPITGTYSLKSGR